MLLFMGTDCRCRGLGRNMGGRFERNHLIGAVLVFSVFECFAFCSRRFSLVTSLSFIFSNPELLQDAARIYDTQFEQIYGDLPRHSIWRGTAVTIRGTSHRAVCSKSISVLVAVSLTVKAIRQGSIIAA